ncbi:MAG TPA: transketolase [Pirellulaceae bacterium]|nr:transketolase [Pirellulaceae bacterium]
MPSTATAADMEQLAINTIRTLSMDAVQKANCGHPGTPMALAPVAYQIWNHNLRFDPASPHWPCRDRFVLSCGHASMLLYSVLHLAGVRKIDKQGKLHDEPAISLDNIKNFRQLGSPCAGHPEYGDAAGIETTTGPLGQGCGNSVGMAMAAKWLAARYNRPGHELLENRVYVLCSDGDLMEGVACEAASLAGHLALNNLLWIYDDNNITIEGETELAFSEDVATRFEGLGWNALRVDDANDLAAIQNAIDAAHRCTDKPTIVVLRSVIGYGSPNKANTHGAHGAPLGESEVQLTKRAYGWPEDAQFFVPPEVSSHFAEGVGQRGAQARRDWEARFAAYEKAYPSEAAELKTLWAGKLPAGWDKDIPVFPADAKGLATRVSSGKVINGIAKNFPWFIGGSADLAPSTMTLMDFQDAGDFSGHNYAGRNLHFGIREHGMGAIVSGLSLAGLRPYGATFFVFTDYMRPSMRLASIMHRPVIYVLTHDSIGLGEDGPTHQPIEHLAACRAIPGLDVVRPGDANEVAECYRAAIARGNHPTALVLSRQNVPTLDRTKFAAASGAAKGAYVLAEAPGGKPAAILIATGSELDIAMKAWEKLTSDGVAVRLVSMPCWEWFDEQDQAYRDSVLPPAVTARIAVEAGVKQGWEKYLGERGRFVGMSSFGASAPSGALYKHFGITPERVAEEVQAGLQDS